MRENIVQERRSIRDKDLVVSPIFIDQASNFHTVFRFACYVPSV
jgi:hypothetical protein